MKNMGYVVILRHKEDNAILSDFGSYKTKAEANEVYKDLVFNHQKENGYYCIEEIDPCGSFVD